MKSGTEVSLLRGAIFDRAPKDGGDRLALIMLPGAKNTPRQLVEHGFIRAVRERALPADVIVLDAHADYYLDRQHIEGLLHHTLDEVLAQGYRRIWLMGISLGGLGSMLCVTQRAADIEGAVLLAPFLGTSGIVAGVAAAGGLAGWRLKDGEETDYERAFLAKVQACAFDEPLFPKIYLGFGRQDRFFASSELLRPRLPPQRVLTIDGGHDWDTWRSLWRGLLDKAPFSLP